MSKTGTARRLANLESGTCPSESSAKLRELAEKNLNSRDASVKSKFFKALADETRLRMLGLLLEREMCVCEVMVALGLTQSTASHHLGILENVGLLQARKDGKWVFYGLSDVGLVKCLLGLVVEP